MSIEEGTYDRLIVYYFSGTGNARNAAQWIIKVAEARGLETHLISIDRFETIEYPELSNKTLIGFCFPTHGFNAPPLIIKFIRKFPKIKNADAFILNTRGGLKLSKVFIPGLSGIAQILPALVLRMKGLRIVGMQPIDLPSNWLLLHPGLKEKVVNSIYERCHSIVNEFADKTISGERNYKALLSLPIDVALLPISMGYYFIGRFFLAKTLIATDACNQCNKCVNNCPVNGITLVREIPFWTYRCENCMRCVNICPQRAIETMHAFSTVLIILSSMLITPLIIGTLQYFDAWKFFDQSIIAKNVWSLINVFLFLIFVFISYRIIHYLMRYKLVNKIITYTSLSKYKFWRRYKAPHNN
jgi:Pyruvate/2-oxoacid:ferredoxin oxidoreductase delta subunit